MIAFLWFFCDIGEWIATVMWHHFCQILQLNCETVQTLPMDADALSGSSPMLLTFDSTVAGVVTSCIGWTTLYWVLCAHLPHYTSEWHCRWVTVLHAVIVVILSAWSVFVQGPWPFTDPGNVSVFHLLIVVIRLWWANSRFLVADPFMRCQIW